MKILSCTASRSDGTRGMDPYGWWVPSGEPIRIILDTEPSFTVREYGGVHTWTVDPDPLDELMEEPAIADSLFEVPKHNIGGEVCYRVPGDLSFEQSSA